MKKLATISIAALLSCSAAVAQQPSDGATATFIDVNGEEVGSVELTGTQDGVSIVGEVTGLSEGPHGFHIHETGECDPETSFKSAGGHFAPQGNQHGLENPDGPHAGDMPNQIADGNGTLQVDLSNQRVSLAEGGTGYLLDEDGSAIVVHSGEDDQTTDPAGDAGDRVACAVIEASEQ